jgi:hypothetical protein
MISEAAFSRVFEKFINRSSGPMAVLFLSAMASASIIRHRGERSANPAMSNRNDGLEGPITELSKVLWAESNKRGYARRHCMRIFTIHHAAF